ncbi:MAG: 3-deoxy-D-manno-octulosonic acid transferase, partial [Nitrospirae bacterium]
ALWGKPIITGPHMENFPLAEEFFNSKAAIKATRERFYDELETLLSGPEEREKIGLKAKELFQRFQGAKTKTLETMERVLQSGGC